MVQAFNLDSFHVYELFTRKVINGGVSEVIIVSYHKVDIPVYS